MSSIFEFKIKIVGLSPPVWRKVQMNAEDTFEDLHMLFQIVFGWQNVDLFEFYVDKVRITMPDEEGFLEGYEKNAFTTPLSSLLEEGKVFTYTYDFENSWKHEVTLVEELENEKLIFPNCLNGERSGPLEDTDGVDGYSQILSVLEDVNNTSKNSLFIKRNKK